MARSCLVADLSDPMERSRLAHGRGKQRRVQFWIHYSERCLLGMNVKMSVRLFGYVSIDQREIPGQKQVLGVIHQRIDAFT